MPQCVHFLKIIFLFHYLLELFFFFLHESEALLCSVIDQRSSNIVRRSSLTVGQAPMPAFSTQHLWVTKTWHRYRGSNIDSQTCFCIRVSSRWLRTMIYCRSNNGNIPHIWVIYQYLYCSARGPRVASSHGICRFLWARTRSFAVTSSDGWWLPNAIRIWDRNKPTTGWVNQIFIEYSGLVRSTVQVRCVCHKVHDS